MKKIKLMLLSIMLMSIPMLTLAATGHIDGCTNTGADTSCCTKTYNITAKTGYQVTNVLVNGTSKGAVASVTLSSIKGPQSIKVVSQYTGPYTITFNANGGSGTMNPIAVANGASVTLTANAFTKSGKAFKGWSTSSNGSVTYNNAASVTPSSHLTLYAVWGEVTTFTLTSSGVSYLNGSLYAKWAPYPMTIDGTSYTSTTGTETYTLTVNKGASITVTAANPSLPSATFNGTSVNLPYTFTVTGDITITGVIQGVQNVYASGATSGSCVITMS